MPTGQFIVYRSSDAAAPTLTGTAGTLLTVLDAVLVTGYGTKAAAGWTKPFANSGNIGCYKNSASGTGLCISVNDNGPGAAGAKEARIFGFELLASVSTGTGQFPSSVFFQGANNPSFVVCRKSADALTARSWIIVADQYTIYMFVLTGDTAGNYQAWAFGDIFSMKGSSDAYRCLIVGRQAENQSAANQDDLPNLNALGTISAYNYMARSSGGGGFCITVTKHGDATKGAAWLAGNLTMPNPVDNAIYVSPVWVVEQANGMVRGRMRGFYQILHAIANFTDGQTFPGSGDYAGKTFLVIKGSTDNGGNNGMYVMEISNTVETN